MSKAPLHPNCIVPGCSSSKARHPHLDFYAIPSNKEEEWLTLINRLGLLPEFQGKNKLKNRYKICSLHFDDSMIVLHRTLSPNATPAFNLPEKSDSENLFLADKFVQTDEKENFEKSRLWELNEATFIYSQSLKETEKRSLSTQTWQEGISHTEIITETSNTQTSHEDILYHAETATQSSSNISAAQEMIQTSNSVFIYEDNNIDEPFATPSNGDFDNMLKDLSAWVKNIKAYYYSRDKNLFKRFALVLYFSCTPLYENIQKSLNLPPVSTLLKWSIDFTCALDRPIVNFYLSHKLILMGNKSKYCILFLHAIDIKPHVYYNITKDKFVGLQQSIQKHPGGLGVKATKALCMMLRGIQNDWQQLINCFFINEQKSCLHSENIDGTLKTVANIGFQVKTIVMDPNPYIYRYAKEVLNITIEKPYILFDSMEVYFMFEPRDLILRIRDLLLENDFYNNNGKISWKYVQDLHLHKEKYKLSILPKLTKAHVCPDERQKTNFKYASEIFSDEVCSTLEFYISLSLIPREALPTARFIRSVSFLIDIFSSNTVNHENELKCAFKMNKQQCSVLLYLQDLLKTLMIVSKETKSIITDNIFDCMLITIHSLILLNNSLKEVGISRFMTKRFHRDPIDKLKKKVSNASKGKVTAVKLLKILGNNFIRQLIRDKKFYDIPNNLTELYKRGINIAASVTQLEKNSNHLPKRIYVSSEAKSLKGDFDYRFRLPERRKITYLSAYLFYKCYKKHRCLNIELEWRKMNISEDIPWNDCLPFILKGNLRKPTPAFQQIVYQLEQVFVKNFFFAKEKPVDMLLSDMKVVTEKYKPVCKCFPVDYLLLLFIRHRIYSVLMHDKELSKIKPSHNMVLNKIVN